MEDFISTKEAAVGSADFKYLSKEAYYVDKTLLIKEIIDLSTGFFLITRPHRFGKTLNLHMIQTFFERTEEDTAAYFADKKIWHCDRMYRDQQGKYPVITLRLEHATGRTWRETHEKLRALLIAEVNRHRELTDSDACGEEYQELLDCFAAEGEDAYDFENTLRDLSRLLAAHYDTPAIILVDDYDAPLLGASRYGFYEEAADFLGNLLCGGLKDNDDVRYGILTGVLQVSMERVFDQANNVTFWSVLSPRFGACFGYTEEDVREMAAPCRRRPTPR